MEKKKSKWKTWHIVVLSLVGSFFLLMAIAVNSEADKKENDKKIEPVSKIPETPVPNYDALITRLKKDTLFHVVAAKVEDDSLFIAISDPDKGYENGHAYYFLQTYNIDTSGTIAKCLVYLYNKKNPHANVFESKPIGGYLSNWKWKELSDMWGNLYMSTLDGSCTPVKKYLRNLMNDADSYENVETTYDLKRSTSHVVVDCRFRGKNEYGAKVLNRVRFLLDLDGNILKVKNVE